MDEKQRKAKRRRGKEVKINKSLDIYASGAGKGTVSNLILELAKGV